MYVAERRTVSRRADRSARVEARRGTGAAATTYAPSRAASSDQKKP